MGLGTAIAIYFVVWWTTLFVTLPFRMRAQRETGYVTPGTEEAAPANPQLMRRMLWNTVLAGVVFAIYWLVFYVWGFGLADIPELVPIRPMQQS